MNFVKKQEAAKGFLPTAKKVREQPKDGCTHQIGYGKNIRPDSELMRKTLTEQDAINLLIKDLIEKRGVAKRIFDKTVGSGKFDMLSESQ